MLGKRRIRLLTVCSVLAALTVLLAACAPRLPLPAPAEMAQTPADFPEAYYRQAEASGRRVLRVAPERSLVVIEVHRAGAFARLGHEHVVASHEVKGYVDLAEGRSDLYVALERLVVDEPGLRAEAGFDTQVSPEAVDGTRRNMLDKVLDSARFPFVLIHATRADAKQQSLSLSITLHGRTRSFEIPVRIEEIPGGIAVSGRMAFNQTDFGVTPLSVLGGALQVQDRLDLRFRIVATG